MFFNKEKEKLFCNSKNPRSEKETKRSNRKLLCEKEIKKKQ